MMVMITKNPWRSHTFRVSPDPWHQTKVVFYVFTTEKLAKISRAWNKIHPVFSNTQTIQCVSYKYPIHSTWCFSLMPYNIFPFLFWINKLICFIFLNNKMTKIFNKYLIDLREHLYKYHVQYEFKKLYLQWH